MAAADNQFTDLGIVLYMDLSPTGKTYIDKFGQTVDCELLQTDFAPMVGAQAVKSATHAAGVPEAHSYWVLVGLTGEGNPSITVRLVCQYGNDPGLSPAVDSRWARVQVINEDDGTTANEITFTTSGLYLLQTASEHTTGRSRWEAELSNGAPPSAFVRIAGRAY